MRKVWSAWLVPLTAVTAVSVLACGGKETPKPPPPTTVATAQDVGATGTSAAPDAAPVKASRAAEGDALLQKELDAGGVKAALEVADALATEDAAAAKVTGARVRLAAVAAALDADPTGATLGEGGAEKQLRLVVGAGDLGDAGKPVQSAARVLLALGGAADAGAKVTEAREVLAAATPEGQAVRLVALGVLGRALDAGSDAKGFEALTHGAGALLCEGCRDAATLMTPQLKALAEKPYVDGAGFACLPGAALALGSPCAAVAALAAVPDANGGANQLALAALELEQALRDAPPGPAPLGGAIKAALAKLPKRMAYALPTFAGDLGQPILGSGGLAPGLPALAVVVVGTSDIKMGTRPVVLAGGQAVKSAADLADAPATLLADVAELQPDPKTGAVPVLAERATAVAAAARTEGERPTPAYAPKGVELAIVPGASSKAVQLTADALRAAGFESFAVTRPQAVGAALPLYLRSAPTEIEAPLVATFEKPIIVVVSAEAIDVWGPDKAKEGGAPVGAEAQADVPTSAQPGWRGETLARLRVPIPPPAPERPRLEAAVLRDAKVAVDFWQSKTKVGPVVHVVAADGAGAWDVLAVAHALQEAPKKDGQPVVPLATWPGAKCPSEAADCASAMVVAFSGIAVPSDRGLADKPKKGDKKEPKEPKEPTPPPSDEFCNKGDIQTQMRKRAGSFRFCYEKELQLQKDLAGRLNARFTIDLGGKPKGVSVGGDLPNKDVGACIANEVKKMTFAPPAGGECVVNWPFVFKAN